MTFSSIRKVNIFKWLIPDVDEGVGNSYSCPLIYQPLIGSLAIS